MSDLSKYIGIPFKSKGRDFDGLDCWGLIYLFYKNELGIELPKYIGFYDDAILDRKSIHALVEYGRRMDWERIFVPQKYDVVLFRSGIYLVHVGLVIDPDRHKMLHIEKDVNSCIEDYYNLKWNARVEGFYRYIGRDRL